MKPVEPVTSTLLTSSLLNEMGFPTLTGDDAS